MDSRDLDKRVRSINFILDSCRYRLRKIKEEIERHQRFKEPGSSDQERLMEDLKAKGATRLEFGIPFTITFKPGQATLLYEFNAFVTDTMTCVNYITDLKMWLLDGYTGKRAVTIARYNSPGYRKNIKDKGRVHRLLVESYEDWLKNMNKLRNTIIHEYAEDKVSAIWQGEVRLTENSKLTYKNRMGLKLPDLSVDDLEVYCVENLKKLEGFVTKTLRLMVPS